MLAYTSQFTEHCLTFLNSYAVYVIYFQAVMELHDLNKTYLYNTHIQNCLGSVRFVLLLFKKKKKKEIHTLIQQRCIQLIKRHKGKI